VNTHSHGRSVAALAIMVSVFGVAYAGTSAAFTPAPPPPVSLTDCAGSLSPDPSGRSVGEPYLTDYRFSCGGAITSYTIVVNRQAGNTANLDDFDSTPGVFLTDGVTPSSSLTAQCSGVTPSDGINCNFGAGGTLATGDWAAGAVDLVAPFCKSPPANGKPGSLAIPRAIVQLIVTDATGAQDGPFDLGFSRRCPRVPNVAPDFKHNHHRNTSRV